MFIDSGGCVLKHTNIDRAPPVTPTRATCTLHLGPRAATGAAAGVGLTPVHLLTKHYMWPLIA